MQIFMRKKKKKMMIKSKSNAKSQTHQQNPKRTRCRALCCGSSRLSVSSTTSCSEPVGSSDTELINSLSNMAHGMVQARLEHIIGENSQQLGFNQRQRRDGFLGKSYSKPVSNTSPTDEIKKYVVLVAMEQDSYDPKEDFRKSIMEVITCKGLVEPKELKGLLNCYVSMNSREHRQAILEAFVDVCSTLFVSKRGSYVHW